MATNLGRKHTCYSCQTKFYDLGKPQAICPKCGADQRDAETAAPPSSRTRRAPAPVEVPVEEEFDAAEEGGEAADDDDETEEQDVEDDDEDEDEDEDE